MLVKTEPKLFNKCSECPGLFEKKCDLEQHFLRIHGQFNHLQDRKIYQFQCRNCKKTFNSENLLKIHHRLVHETKGKIENPKLPRKIKCQRCEKGFKYQKSLEQHFKRVHGSKRLEKVITLSTKKIYYF